MSVVSGPPQAVYVAAVETLAESVTRALRGAGNTFCLEDQLSDLEGDAGLAAVRVLGADVLTPFTLGGHPFTSRDAEVIAASIDAFPAETSTGAGTSDGRSMPVHAVRDWAIGEVLAQLGVDDFRRVFPAQATDYRCAGADWSAWSTMLMGTSPLAVPGLDSGLHVEARGQRLGTARGVVRAMVRGDYLSAARLGRWLAAGGTPEQQPSVRIEPLLRHLELVAGTDPRTVLEMTITRRAWGRG